MDTLNIELEEEKIKSTERMANIEKKLNFVVIVSIVGGLIT